ncbi:hypothetical protein B0T09DRAFT_336554 [Sordaria sp. MPI-SDFR-AT-0083]|nr:hypothetical protein B0T09DRAFT_336554 [Sordaria sp. MPI-SDFR-AT-0083]
MRCLTLSYCLHVSGPLTARCLYPDIDLLNPVNGQNIHYFVRRKLPARSASNTPGEWLSGSDNTSSKARTVCFPQLSLISEPRKAGAQSTDLPSRNSST